jgi:hypothetical protein
MGTGVFPGVKRPGRGIDHPSPSSAKVKERVELYLYSLSGFSWSAYLLTPWSRVLLEKLTVNFAASQEISRIYGIRKFITIPTSVTVPTNSWFVIG